jgi:hypothetical protein
MSFGLRSIRFGGMLAPPNHCGRPGSHNILVGGNKLNPRSNLFAKQIKTQNKAICFFFFLYKFQTTNVPLDTYRFQALS